ncbi:MAG: hypothetical protein ACREPD_15550 [Stenotrophomonas sp.]|uniref:hypothetical protein n=1 Tax=Stenotrophomonas sp. TaxID=69392 RepID=UPI003D6D43E9
MISVIEVYGAVKAATLPFGLRLGADIVETLGRTFPVAGGEAFVVPDKSGVVIVKTIREPGAEYDFELRLRYDTAGRLVSVECKDVV